MTNSGNELTTVLKCSGGEDEYGAAISIVPAIPDCVMNWFNEFRAKECKVDILVVSDDLIIQENLVIQGDKDIGNWSSAKSFDSD